MIPARPRGARISGITSSNRSRLPSSSLTAIRSAWNVLVAGCTPRRFALTAGGSATLDLVGGPANTPAFLVLGLVNGPVPLKGGTLVPFPWAALLAQQTDGSGAISIPGVMGDGTPLTLFLQYVLVDGSQSEGYGFSNALQVEF